MTNPVDFADRFGQLGITLPEPVLLAVARVRALDAAIQRLSSDQAAATDVRVLDPGQVVRALHRAMQTEARAAAVHGNAVHRLRVATVAEATRQIRDHGDTIVTVLRTAHDPLAAQLAADTAALDGIDSAVTLATADDDTRARWAANPARWQQWRTVHSLRFYLAETG